MPDSVDHCAEAERLRALRVALVTGQATSQVRFDNEEVRFFKADGVGLDRLIAFHEQECARAQGVTIKRTRYAKRARFAPY